MAKDKIIVKGARQNNLKDIDVEIPKNKLTVITGLSGSGKSSLAFDIIYAEGYRRYVENLSAQARFFLNDVRKPEVDSIDNLSPAIAIDQKRDSKNPRSTVGTVLGVYDFLRILFAEVGEVYCPHCQISLQKNDEKEILNYLKTLPRGTEVYILAPQKISGDLEKELKNIANQGYAKVRLDNKIFYVDSLLVRKQKPKTKQVDIVVDRLNIDKNKFDQERIVDSLQIAAKLSDQPVIVSIEGEKDIYYSKSYNCPQCDFKLAGLKRKNFSFNSPEGACPKCGGLGEVYQAELDKIIPNKNLSINEGAIVPWSRLNGNGESGRRQAILKALAKKYKFSLNKPIKKIPAEIVEKIIFSGENNLNIKLKGKEKVVDFKGVAKELEEKYQQKQGVSSELERYLTKKICSLCRGKRLKEEFLAVKVLGKSIDQLSAMEIRDLINFFSSFEKKLDKFKEKKPFLEKLIKEIIARLQPVAGVGVEYLNLNRASNTLSGGEFQRLRLSTQLQNKLSNLIYVLDEPSVGLHSSDVKNLIKSLKEICRHNNTVIVVEHDREMIKSADHIIDIGPKAGQEGGRVIFSGDVQKLKKAKTETARFLFKKPTSTKSVVKRKAKKNIFRQQLIVKGAKEHNLKNIDVKIPLKHFVAVTGVSGSGKSSLVIDVLAKGLKKKLNKGQAEAGKCKAIEGAEQVSKLIMVNQSPIGRSPRSNAATYTGVFSHIRKVFAETELAKKKGLSEKYFSFNMKGGRCEYCQGEGVKKVEMQLLGGVYTDCPHCGGTRYNKKVREIEYQGASIVDVLNMSVEYAYHFFNSKKVIARKLKVLLDVGLGYLKLGQNATELSGGEAQRVKLATELIKQSNRGALYILDEPTVGLHFSDIQRLLKVINKLVEKGNSVIVIEHNEDMIYASDWVIELGPGGGKKGGKVVFSGTPEQMIKKS